MMSEFFKPVTQVAVCLAVAAFVALQGCVQPPETAGVSHVPIALQPEVATRDEPLAGARVAVRDEPAVDKRMLTARITVTPREHSFTVSLYLRSASGQDVRVIRGRGSAGVQNVPEFFLGDLRITPSTYVHPPRRTTIPDTQVISPEYETLYGSFTMDWPTGWEPTWPRRDREKEIRARIAFPELGVTVETEAVSIEPVGPAGKMPGVGFESEYTKEIDRLQAAGQLEAIKVDHDEDGTADLVLHLQDGGLVKLVEYPHLVKAELPLPEWGEYDRIEYGHHSAKRPNFTVAKPAELRLFHECLKRASHKLNPGWQMYYRPDGEPPLNLGIGGGGWGSTGPSLLFKKGDAVLCRGQVWGAKCWLSRTERGDRVYFINRALGPLVRRQMEKAGYFGTESQ